MASAARTTLQHRVWRWHFFAGLMVIPFALILATTGSIYLFKPQFEAAIEARINANAAPLAGVTLPADTLVTAALAPHSDAVFARFYMPQSADDPTAEIEVLSGGSSRTVWVDRTTGAVLHDVPTADRFMNFIKRIHGTLLAGDRGSLVVEVMASWMIILIITGTYLWWPRDRAWWRIFVPEFKSGMTKRGIWRNLHGTGGAWIGVFVLALLLSGLPWTQVWGDGFTRAKALAGLKTPGQEWFVTLQSGNPEADHSMHDKGGALWSTGEPPAMETGAPDPDALSLEEILQRAKPEQYASPVEIQPPRGENGVWTIRSMAASRPDRVTIHHDRWTGKELLRIAFKDHNPVDRFVALGVAFHEGGLFGWLNQALGVLAASGVILLSVSGGVMWWRRRPAGRLGTPPMPADKRLAIGLVALILALGLFLPMAGVTLLAALAADGLISLAGRMRRKPG
jgi:uncharacterized iron-regulated membrane protein